MRIEKPCEVCGTIVSRKPSQMSGPKRGHAFCSRACYGKWRAREFVGEAHHNYTPKIPIPCEHCGKTLMRTAAYIAKNQHHFCGHRCKGQWQADHLIGDKNPRWVGAVKQFQCAECGSTFSRLQSQASYEKQFCSYKCMGRWFSRHRVGEKHPTWKGGQPQIQCDTCNNIFSTTASNLKNYKHHFCGPACRNKWISQNMAGSNSPQWRGGWSSYYGPNWNAQQRAARKRDKHKCQHCGKTQKQNKKALDVHHIKPFREFGYVVGQNENHLLANDLTNLISLCPKCHKAAEIGKVSIQPYLL